MGNDGSGAILEYGRARGMVRRFGSLSTNEGEPNTARGTLQAQAEMAMTSDVGAIVWPIATANERMDVDNKWRGIGLLLSQLQKQH